MFIKIGLIISLRSILFIKCVNMFGSQLKKMRDEIGLEMPGHEGLDKTASNVTIALH